MSEIIRAAPILSNPLDVSDRILVDFSRAARPFFANVTVDADQSLDYFLPHVQDLYRILNALVELGYIKSVSQLADRWTGAMAFAGWERVRKIEHLIPDAWRAFVAMSFDASLDAAWTDGIRPALESTGYSAIRVDKVPHLGKIDDKIISELRMASIVIADFTLHRAGVYFEAGVALGRGVPVVWCCRKSDIEESHFDTRQYNHVVWSEPSDLQEQLRVRLIATVPTREASGPGPSTA